MVFFDKPLSWLTEQSRKKVVREKNVQNFLVYTVVKKNRILEELLTVLIFLFFILTFLSFTPAQMVKNTTSDVGGLKYYKIYKTVSRRLIFVSVLFFLTAYPSVFEEFIIFN